MNFIGKMINGPSIHVELKYCERCGGIFLRVRGTGLVYCTRCALQLAARTQVIDWQSPLSRCRKRNPRMVKAPTHVGCQAHGTTQIKDLQGIAGVEVRIC